MTTEAKLERALQRLHDAIARGRTVPYCRSLWSQFVRLRDGERCVVCHDDSSVAAHHIIRKSLLAEAHLQTGNGISLCRSCHKQPHEVFNRRPNLNLPMDAEGGEDIELLTEFFWRLLTDAKERNLLRDDFYFLSDHALGAFKITQGFAPHTPFPGGRLEQAYLIWRQTPRGMLDAVLAANGFALPPGFIQQGHLTVWFD
ncbi:HNH endonuclease [Aeromonas rivipollensis]